MAEIALYHGTTLDRWQQIQREGLGRGTYLAADAAIAAFYAYSRAQREDSPAAVVLLVRVSTAWLVPDWISFAQPVMLAELNRDEWVGSLEALGHTGLQEIADELDAYQEDNPLPVPEEFAALVEQLGFPETHDWPRSLVMVGSVRSTQPIPPSNIALDLHMPAEAFEDGDA